MSVDVILITFFFLFLPFYEGELSELATEREGGQLNQQRKLKGEQTEQPKERETPDDIFRLLAEVKELTKIAYEGDI